MTEPPDDRTQGRCVPGFAWKYGVDRLVWSESHETRESAWLRERQMKKWRRAWKIELIERLNPDWRDLIGEIPN
jgi:putative endonuclease